MPEHNWICRSILREKTDVLTPAQDDVLPKTGVPRILFFSIFLRTPIRSCPRMAEHQQGKVPELVASVIPRLIEIPGEFRYY